MISSRSDRRDGIRIEQLIDIGGGGFASSVHQFADPRKPLHDELVRDIADDPLGGDAGGIGSYSGKEVGEEQCRMSQLTRAQVLGPFPRLDRLLFARIFSSRLQVCTQGEVGSRREPRPRTSSSGALSEDEPSVAMLQTTPTVDVTARQAPSARFTAIPVREPSRSGPGLPQARSPRHYPSAWNRSLRSRATPGAGPQVWSSVEAAAASRLTASMPFCAPAFEV